MTATKLILTGLILAGGCATEPPKWKSGQGTAWQGGGQLATNSKEWVKNATEISEDLKHDVVEGKITLTDATRIEKERRTEKGRQVQNALDRIKKEAREEYAANRPEPIKQSILKEQLCLGMGEKDVLVCLGQPNRKTRTVTRRGAGESWGYSKISVWFEDGLVTGWREED